MAFRFNPFGNGKGDSGDTLQVAVPAAQTVHPSGGVDAPAARTAADLDAAGGRRYANKYRDAAATRDAEIEAFLKKDPMTARMLVDMEVLPNMKVANRRLNRLAKKRTSTVRKFSTQVNLDNKWQCVYFCGPPFGVNMLQHHTEVTALVLMFEVTNYERWNVPCDGDALLWIGNMRYLLEHKRGTQNNKNIEKRVERLQAWANTILWVCRDETDLAETIRQTTAINSRCLYTTFKEAMQDPHAEIWRFADGLTVDLPVGELANS